MNVTKLYWCTNTSVSNCKMWAPNTKYISLLFPLCLPFFRLSSCKSINYFSIVSCILLFLISFSVLPFSLPNHQRYFCSFTYCGRVCKHNLTKRISKYKHLWCICTKSFELLSLIKLFGLIILFWNCTFKSTSLKKMSFSECSILHVSKWGRIIFKYCVIHVSNYISILKFTHQQLRVKFKVQCLKPSKP